MWVSPHDTQHPSLTTDCSTLGAGKKDALKLRDEEDMGSLQLFQ